MESTETDGEKPSTSKRKAEWFEMDESRNPHVYVSGLPTTMTEDEFLDLMKRYGIIAKKATPGNPFNFKMYRDEEGNFKGDARCCFARVESVELAITHLDGYLFDGKHALKCERAKFEKRGDYDPSKKPRTLDQKSKLKQKKKVDKLLSWEEKEKLEVRQRKVILKNMFAPEDFVKEVDLIVEMKDEIEEKCTELVGEPRRVEIFDKHPEGVAEVTFATPEQAEACVRALNGLSYLERLVVAELWDGKTKYRVRETEEEEARRLEQWHEDIQKSDHEDDAAEAETEDEKNPQRCQDQDQDQGAGQ